MLCTIDFQKSKLKCDNPSNLVIPKKTFDLKQILSQSKIKKNKNKHDASILFDKINTKETEIIQFDEKHNIYSKNIRNKKIYDEKIIYTKYLPIQSHYLYSSKVNWKVMIWSFDHDKKKIKNFEKIKIWLQNTKK